ncbi:MAG: polysaccharide biosynthesis protein [Oscillospiraceae bacterium]|nr:polysaccharide biosynthesis protein [Oscillospiraceae bacterium]
MGKIRKQTFLQASLILMFANLTVRVIGAIFRIPIYKLLGEMGYANYQHAYSLYQIFFTISTAGLPVAISKMISIANLNENYEEEKKIFSLALLSFVIVGAAGSGAMMLGAGSYSAFVGNSDAYYSILILAPTLFFVCITSAFRGYFQGRQNMIPTAISEIIEASGKLLIGIAAAMYALAKYPGRLDMAAAFAISGLTVGSAVGALYLYFKKKLMKKHEDKLHENFPKSNLPVRKNREIIGDIIKMSLPIMMTSSIASLAGMIDSFMMTRRLCDIGWAKDLAVGAYGQYYGLAVPFFSLPNTLVVPFAVSIIPVIAAAFSQNNINSIKSTVESTFRVSSMVAMPCAFGLAFLAEPILSLIYPERMDEVSANAPLLSILGIAVIFVSMMTVTNSMLQAQKQERKTIISMACGMLVKVIFSYILIGIPEINRYGTPIGTCLCYFTIMALNFFFLFKYTKAFPSFRKTFLKPFVSGAAMAIFSVLVYVLADRILHFSKIAALLALAIAVFVYFASILICKTLTKDDVLLLPKGDKLYEFMKRKKLI